MLEIIESIDLPPVPGNEYRVLTEDEREAWLFDAIDQLVLFKKQAAPQDRPTAVDAEYFLRGVLRTKERPISDIVLILEQKAQNKKISEALRKILMKSIEEVRIKKMTLSVVPVKSDELKQSPARVGDDAPVKALRDVIPKGIAFHDRIRRALQFAQQNSHKSFDGTPEGCLETLEGLRTVERSLVNDIFLVLISDPKGAYAHTSLDALEHALIRERDSDSLSIDVIAAMNSMLDSTSQVSDFLWHITLVKARIIALRNWLDTRPKIQLRVIKPKVVTKNPFEEEPTVVPSSSQLEEEQQDLGEDEPTQEEPKQEELIHVAPLSQPEVAPKPPSRLRAVHDAACDAVAGSFRTVAVALGLVGGGVALHEFAENDSDEPSVEVSEAPEMPSMIESMDTHQEAVQDIEDNQGEIAQFVPDHVEHIVQKGDRIWDITRGMIDERGLRVTNEKINYLTHLAEKENAIFDDGRTLKIGSVLSLDTVAEALDEMEGKPSVSTEVPLASPSQAPEEWSTPQSDSHYDAAQILPQHDDDRFECHPEWYAGTGISETQSIPKVKEKPYRDVPRVGHETHVMQKGEWIYKIIHLMMREQGLNWSVPRMNRLKNMTLQENGLSEAQAMRIPVGTEISFKNAVQEIQAMAAAKKKEKK